VTLTKTLALRFGRRGLILFTVGAIWILLGQGVVNSQGQDRFSRPGPSPLDWMDSNLWGWLFFACGVVGIISALVRRAAPDAIGFGAIILPAFPWTFFYIYSWMVFQATGGEFGESMTWRGALVWGLICLFIRTCAGWDDPTDPVMRASNDD
jgi:hypothetical protein